MVFRNDIKANWFLEALYYIVAGLGFFMVIAYSNIFTKEYDDEN